MANGVSTITNALESDDTTHARNIVEALGARITTLSHGDQVGIDLEVEGHGIPLLPQSNKFFTGDSGITTRFLLPMLGLRAQSKDVITLDCGEQMRQRPLRPLIDALNNLGMTVESVQKNDRCPLSCRGTLSGGNVTIDGLTSQYCSALLLSLPCAANDSVMIVEQLNERPYVEMTTRWLDEQGIRYTWKRRDGADIFTITGGQRYRPFAKTIPGDFSSASYLIAAGVLTDGEVILEGLDFQDCQPDKQLIPILKAMGANITVEEKRVVVRGGAPLTGTTIDCNDFPDLLPTLAVIATHSRGITRLTNVPQARLKETDRIHAMASELRTLGADVYEEADGLTIGQSRLQGTMVHGYQDHRTIMALAVAGFIADGETTIDTAEGINKTFPGFVNLMCELGANITSPSP